MKISLWQYCIILFLFSCIAACSPVRYSAAPREDTAVQLPIALAGSLQNPAWSPDGNRIVFTRFQNGYNTGPADLVIYDLQSGKTSILVSDSNDNINLPGTSWNPGSNQIVFSSSREPHDEIYTIHADEISGEITKLTDRMDQAAYEPSFSPDGQFIVFESHPMDVETNGIITKYKTNGSEAYQLLTDEHADCRQPNWSPDGGLIVYQRATGTQWDIWVMDANGTNQRQLTQDDGDKTDASFSADGKWIVYSAEGSAIHSANLFIMPVSGGEQIQLTHFTGYDGAPSWSPDGKKIVFESAQVTMGKSLSTKFWVIDVPQLPAQ